MTSDRQRRHSAKGPSLDPWLRGRLRLAPHVLAQALPATRRRFAHAWAPTAVVVRQVRCLPPALQAYLQSCASGWLVIGAQPSTYRPGEQTLHGRTLHNVAYLSVDDLATGDPSPLHAIAHLIDHHLGCRGAPDGPWFSDGGGPTAGWRQVGARIPGLFALGYAVDAIAAGNVRDYLAQSLALFCLERQRLNVADPQIYKLLRSSLLSDGFWRGQDRKRSRPEADDA
jgi:hypothetical protein